MVCRSPRNAWSITCNAWMLVVRQPAPHMSPSSSREAPRLRDRSLDRTTVGKQMLERYAAANHSSNGWRPKQKKGEPYFVALTSQSQPVQKTNSLSSVIAFHEKV